MNGEMKHIFYNFELLWSQSMTSSNGAAGAV